MKAFNSNLTEKLSDKYEKKIKSLERLIKQTEKDKDELREGMSKLAAYLRRSDREKKATYDRYAVFFNKVVFCMQELLGYSKAGNQKKLQRTYEKLKEHIRDEYPKLCEIVTESPIETKNINTLKDIKDAEDVISESRCAEKLFASRINYQRIVLFLLCALTYSDSTGLMEELVEKVDAVLREEGIVPRYYDDFSEEDENRSLFIEINDEGIEIPGLFKEESGKYRLYWQGLVTKGKRCKHLI